MILIAVALFAALSYAITQSGRGSGNIEAEQAMLDEGVAQQCEAAVTHAINRVKLLNGCQSSEISYELADGTNENDDAPDNDSCHLFREEGGGALPCGAYLDPIIETGQISEGDTDTVAVTAGGTYFTCPAWAHGGGFCDAEVSLDGVTYFPLDDVCLLKSDGSDSARGGPWWGSGLLCAAACGGGETGLTAGTSGTKPYYMEDDGSITEFGGECDDTVSVFECDCF